MEAQSKNSRERIGEKAYPTRVVSVVFGNPRSPECAGYGVCRLEEDGDAPPKKVDLLGCCPRTIGTIKRVDKMDEKSYLSLRFFKNDLTAETIDKHFARRHFRMGSAVALPESVSKAFDLSPSNGVLTAGLHALVETAHGFQIQLNIV